MKTPDEIKKWLEYCLGTDDCVGCIYHEDCNQSYRTHIIIDSRDCIRQLEAQVPKWISVEERLPERSAPKVCLIYADGYTCVADWSCDRYGDDWWFYVEGEYDPEVTHWMPLPEPPKEDENE